MFEFSESIQIDTTMERLWTYLVDIERWWPDSNPEHEGIEILDREKTLRKGTRVRIRERVAGVPGEAVGEITEMVERHHIAWKADVARYRLWGVPLNVREGVRWSLRRLNGRVELSARVWATFRGGLRGWLFEWLFKGLLDGVTKDREHTRRELEFIKTELEQA